MPSGKTHEKINLVFLHIVIFMVVLIGCYLYYGLIGLLSSSLLLTGYLFGTYYFGPDLDIASRPFYRWGFLCFIWKPYQKFFHHRSFWTHGILIGDVVRVLYLLFWLGIPYAGFYLVAPEKWARFHNFLCDSFMLYYPQIGFFFLGVCVASLLHILADKIGSAAKKHKRKQNKRSA